jgi:hypothetical protein
MMSMKFETVCDDLFREKAVIRYPIGPPDPVRTLAVMAATTPRSSDDVSR